MHCRLKSGCREDFEQPQFTADAVATTGGLEPGCITGDGATRTRDRYPGCNGTGGKEVSPAAQHTAARVALHDF